MSLRTRTIYDGRDHNVIYEVRHRPHWGNDLLGFTQVPVHSFSKYATITDWNHKKIRDAGIYPAGSCDHVQIYAALKDCDNPFRWSNYPGENTESYATPSRAVYPLTPRTVLDIFPQPIMPPIVYADLNLSAWETFREQIPSKVSLINFLWELTEFESMIPKFSKNLPKTANNTFLNYSFGWKPFIGDLQNFVNLIKNITNRLNYLRAIRGKTVPVRFRRFGAYTDSRVGTFVKSYEYDDRLPNSWTNYRMCYIKLRSRQIDYFASCHLFHELDGLNDAWSTFKAAVAGLNINNPASIVWEAIPFSFVLDWFLPVGKFLRNFSVQPFAGRWEISNLVNTLHDRAILECYYGSDDPNLAPESLFVTPGGGAVLPYRQLYYKGFVSYDRYTRIRGLPLTMEGVGFTDLTDDQQKLFLSLLAGRTVLK